MNELRENGHDLSDRISAAIYGNVLGPEDGVINGAGRVGGSIPRQAPGRTANFVGRRDDLDHLSRFWSDEPQASGGLVVVSGAPGIGKTAFATYWAQHNERMFVDGTLYVNLRGFDPAQPMTSDEALSGFLRSLGIPPAKIPTSVDEAAALYRSVVSGMQLLIVLDNASSAEQVRPLLPSADACRVIVTSRSRLSGLVIREGAHRITLDLLTEAESMELFARVIGQEAVTAQPDSARRLSALGGRLPLALRIIAERCARTGTDLRLVANELEAELAHLDIFDVPDDEASTARYVFAWSYDRLGVHAAKAFRFLGLHPGPDFSVGAAAAMLDVTDAAMARELDGLAGVHLIESSANGRYLLHDLMRQYAQERCTAVDSREVRDAALVRVLGWYADTVAEADRVFVPDLPPIVMPPDGARRLSFHDHSSALSWCESERANIVAGVLLADGAGLSDIAWKLSLIPWSFYELRKHWNDWTRTHEVGLRNARLERDSLAEAMILNSLGIAYRDLRRFDEALPCFEESLRIRTEISDSHGQAINLNSIGITLRELGRLEEAVTYSEKSLAIRRTIGFRWGEAHCLHDLGVAYLELGLHHKSAQLLGEALEIWQEIAAPWGESITLVALASTHARLGELEDAIRSALAATDVARAIGNRLSEADGLQCLAAASRLAGDLEDALRAVETSLSVRRSIGHDYGEVLGLVELARILVDMRRVGEAELALRKAFEVAATFKDSGTTAILSRAADELGMDRSRLS